MCLRTNTVNMVYFLTTNIWMPNGLSLTTQQNLKLHIQPFGAIERPSGLSRRERNQPAERGEAFTVVVLNTLDICYFT